MNKKGLKHLWHLYAWFVLSRSVQRPKCTLWRSCCLAQPKEKQFFMQPQGTIVSLNSWEMMHTVSKMHQWLEWHPPNKFRISALSACSEVSNKGGRWADPLVFSVMHWRAVLSSPFPSQMNSTFPGLLKGEHCLQFWPHPCDKKHLNIGLDRRQGYYRETFFFKIGNLLFSFLAEYKWNEWWTVTNFNSYVLSSGNPFRKWPYFDEGGGGRWRRTRLYFFSWPE